MCARGSGGDNKALETKWLVTLELLTLNLVTRARP